MRYRLDRLVASLRDLSRRAVLTVRYHGWRELLVRLTTAPARLTPLGAKLLRNRGRRWGVVRSWYRRVGKPVAIVIPHYGEATLTIQAIESIKATTNAEKVHIIVSDDGSEADHLARLKAIDGITVVESPAGNTGFAANANRGISAAGDLDVVLLNSDAIAMPRWLEYLQWEAYRSADIGIAGPKLLYPDGTIQSAGSHRNLGAPEWFDHRYRFKPATHGPANVLGDVLAITGAALYLKRRTIETIGVFDEAFGMAYEDVDLCLRCWEAGLRVLYAPRATLTHLESKTRPTEPGPRELQAQRYFWEKWGPWFENRDVRTPSGSLRVVYVTESTGLGGGHRVAFEHLNGLRERGHDAELWTLGKHGAPDWFDLEVPVRTFPAYEELLDELEPLDAIKVATWWNTAVPVWRAAVRNGIAAFFVQDIETSYYPGQPEAQSTIIDSYRHEFRYLTTSQWVAGRLREHGVDPVQVPPGIDSSRWHRLPDVEREDDVVLAVGRTNPLKNFPLTAAAYKTLPPDARPQLWLFGIEPQVGKDLGARYFERPSDVELNVLYNRATVLVQTSRHEGFCLPLLEAMAAGLPVICTDADGNRDFARDEENCLLVSDDAASVAQAITRVLGDPALRERLAEGGLRTAAAYELQGQLDKVDRFYESLAPAAERRQAGSGLL